MSYRSDFKSCKYFAERFLLLSKEFEEEKDTVKRRVSSARLHETGRDLEKALFNFDKEHRREKQKAATYSCGIQRVFSMSVSFPLSAGRTDEHYTPPEVFEALGCQFDLDPCQPAEGRAFLSVPTDHFYTPSDDGLVQPWSGFVWLNPPFGGRNGIVPWLHKFLDHGNGIALANALTSCGWFHDFAPQMDALLFPRGKTKFVRPDGEIGKSPQNGIVLMGLGRRAVNALANAQRNGFGLMLTTRNRAGEKA